MIMLKFKEYKKKIKMIYLFIFRKEFNEQKHFRFSETTENDSKVCKSSFQ